MGCSRKPWVPSTCASDLRKLLSVPLRSQGHCGVGRGLSELHWVWCNGRGPHDKLRQEPQGSSPGFECAGSDSDRRVPAELGQESQASSCVEEGTFAAKHYKDDIPQEKKERRVDTLMAIQQSISSEILSQMVGTTQCVVIDREEEEYYVGRTQYDSPEVDCEVLIEKEAKGERLEAGNYYEVTIIKSEDFDLYAQL